MNRQLTGEQMKNLWEWCGFQWVSRRFWRDLTEYSGYWQSPIAIEERYGHYVELPPIDLNNLFKYAVPKVIEKLRSIPNYGRKIGEEEAFAELFRLWQLEGYTALALFWAIYKIAGLEE